MLNQSEISAPASEIRKPSRFDLHLIVLIIAWLASTLATIIMLLQGVRDTDQFQTGRYILQSVYVLALMWYLSRTGPSSSQLPDMQSPVFPSWRYGKLIPVLGIASMLALIVFSDQGISILTLLLMIATVWILVAWRREIRLPMFVSGLAVAIIAFLAGFLYMNHGFVSQSGFIIFLSFVPPMFIAGGLLVKRTKLGEVQLLTGDYVKTLQSLLWGCLLFVPLGLFNALEGSPGTEMNWMTHWWMPFSLPWYSGIFEETWFRLLLVGLCYLLLRPVFVKYPALAVVLAMLISATSFGLGHGRTLEKFLTTGLLYGLPMAFVFVFRDWEHAVGGHYMVNMIPTMMVFIEN